MSKAFKKEKQKPRLNVARPQIRIHCISRLAKCTHRKGPSLENTNSISRAEASKGGGQRCTTKRLECDHRSREVLIRQMSGLPGVGVAFGSYC